MRGLFVTALLIAALPAGAASRFDPSTPGRFPIGDTTLTLVDAARGRTLVTEIWYPAAATARDASPRAGRLRWSSWRTATAASVRTTST